MNVPILALWATRPRTWCKCQHRLGVGTFATNHGQTGCSAVSTSKAARSMSVEHTQLCGWVQCGILYDTELRAKGFGGVACCIYHLGHTGVAPVTRSGTMLMRRYHCPRQPWTLRDWVPLLVCHLLRQPSQTHRSSVAHHWMPVQRAMSMKFSPPMTLLARRAMSVVAAAAAGIFLATVTSTRCSKPYTSCAHTGSCHPLAHASSQPSGKGRVKEHCRCCIAAATLGPSMTHRWSSNKLRQQRALQVIHSIWNDIPDIGRLPRCP